MSNLDKFIKAHQHYDKGINLIEKGALKKASLELSKALELNHKYTLAFINLGKLYYRLGHRKLAMMNLQSALNLDPNDDQTRYLLAGWEYQQKRFQSSADNYKRILVNVNWTDKPGADKALTFYQNQNYQMAAHALQAILSKLDFH